MHGCRTLIGRNRSRVSTFPIVSRAYFAYTNSVTMDDDGDGEFTESRQYVLASVRRHFPEFSDSQLARLHRAGLIGYCMQRAKGLRTTYRTGTAERVVALSRLEEDLNERRLRFLGWIYWWSAGTVEEEFLQRLLGALGENMSLILSDIEVKNDPQLLSDLIGKAARSRRAFRSVELLRSKLGPAERVTMLNIVAEVLGGRFAGFSETPDSPHRGGVAPDPAIVGAGAGLVGTIHQELPPFAVPRLMETVLKAFSAYVRQNQPFSRFASMSYGEFTGMRDETKLAMKRIEIEAQTAFPPEHPMRETLDAFLKDFAEEPVFQQTTLLMLGAFRSVLPPIEALKQHSPM